MRDLIEKCGVNRSEIGPVFQDPIEDKRLLDGEYCIRSRTANDESRARARLSRLPVCRVKVLRPTNRRKIMFQYCGLNCRQQSTAVQTVEYPWPIIRARDLWSRDDRPSWVLPNNMQRAAIDAN